MRIVVIHYIPHTSFAVRYTFLLNHLEFPHAWPTKISVRAKPLSPNASDSLPTPSLPTTIRSRKFTAALPLPPGIHEDSIPNPETPHGNPCVVTLRITDPSIYHPVSDLAVFCDPQVGCGLISHPASKKHNCKMRGLQGRYGCNRD